MTGKFDISIHVLREESDFLSTFAKLPCLGISIHVLREESDSLDAVAGHGDLISIHVLREESDGSQPGRHRGHRDFNPRSP